MVQFQINDILIELTDDITLLDAKKEIMKQCNVDKSYIDIDVNQVRPFLDNYSCYKLERKLNQY